MQIYIFKTVFGQINDKIYAQLLTVPDLYYCTCQAKTGMPPEGGLIR